MSPKNRRGEYMAWYWMTWSLANVLGPTVGFWLISHIGYSMFWVTICMLTSISLLLNFKLQRIPIQTVQTS